MNNGIVLGWTLTSTLVYSNQCRVAGGSWSGNSKPAVRLLEVSTILENLFSVIFINLSLCLDTPNLPCLSVAAVIHFWRFLMFLPRGFWLYVL
jgi:hypothetical protein